MKARDTGPPEVPDRFLRENRPADPAEWSAWSRERAEWYRANGYSYLEVLLADRAEGLRRRAASREGL